MSKFLDQAGVGKLWAKIKELLKTTVTDKIGVAEGIATLDTNSKLSADQIPVLKTINGTSIVGEGDIEIKFDLIKVVDTLPAKPDKGDENKIFLVPSAVPYADEDTSVIKNEYIEYIWKGTAWEEVGKFIADVDLSNYVQKTDLASETSNGLMSKEDKEKLDSIETMTLDELDAIINGDEVVDV